MLDKSKAWLFQDRASADVWSSSCIDRVFVWQDDLPERFAALIADPPTDLRACRTKALIWMPVRELARYPTPPLHACASSQRCGMLVHTHCCVYNLTAMWHACACAPSRQCGMLVHHHSCLCSLTAVWHACAFPQLLVHPHSCFRNLTAVHIIRRYAEATMFHSVCTTHLCSQFWFNFARDSLLTGKF